MPEKEDFYNVCGWLSTKGEHFQCGTFAHEFRAKDFMDEFYPEVFVDKESEYFPYTQALINCGWICIKSLHNIDYQKNLTFSQYVWILSHLKFFNPNYVKEVLDILKSEKWINQEDYDNFMIYSRISIANYQIKWKLIR
jgi:hypothetical protein